MNLKWRCANLTPSGTSAAPASSREPNSANSSELPESPKTSFEIDLGGD